MSYHTPVLLQEAIEGLNVSEGKRYIDATFGGGGHTKRMLELGAEVLSIDTDSDAIQEAKTIQNKRFRIVQGNFRDIDQIAHLEQYCPVDGILFDLGVSSHQLDDSDRGFSYRFPEAPFDLRLNQEEGISASEVVEKASEEQLKNIIRTYGEEEACGAIAHAFVRGRRKKSITTTGDVLKLIQDTVGENGSNEIASRVFQAFRIYVNDELASLKKGLEGAEKVTKVGGRIAVISFHSLEDRIVKQFFQKPGMKSVYKKLILPGQEEQQNNKRSRSAKLRIGEKL